MFVFVGFIFLSVFPTPSCPYPLCPQVHTSPFAFNAAKWFQPPTIFAAVSFPFPFTFIFIFAIISFCSSFSSIYVVPVPCAVTIPVLLTVAILLSSVLNVTFGVSGLFVNTLNPSISEYCICFLSPCTCKFIVLFLLISILLSCIHHGLVKLSVVPFPICP